MSFHFTIRRRQYHRHFCLVTLLHIPPRIRFPRFNLDGTGALFGLYKDVHCETGSPI